MDYNKFEVDTKTSLTLLPPPKVISKETINSHLEELAIEELLDYHTIGIILRMYIQPTGARNPKKGGDHNKIYLNISRYL